MRSAVLVIELPTPYATYLMLHKLYVGNVFMILAGIDANITSAFSSPTTDDIEGI